MKIVQLNIQMMQRPGTQMMLISPTKIKPLVLLNLIKMMLNGLKVTNKNKKPITMVVGNPTMLKLKKVITLTLLIGKIILLT
jgi:hypothetical protein